MTYNFDYFYNLFKNTDLKFTICHDDKHNNHEEVNSLIFNECHENKFSLKLFTTKSTEKDKEYRFSSIKLFNAIFGNHVIQLYYAHDKQNNVFRYDSIKDCKFENKVLSITLNDDLVVQIDFN